MLQSLGTQIAGHDLATEQQILFPFRLLDNIEQRSLCNVVGLCWLSILNITMSTYESQTPYPFIPYNLSFCL